MTTKITVDAHAGWPVLVEAVDSFPNKELHRHTLAIVEPNNTQDFHIFDVRQLIITEMKKEQK